MEELYVATLRSNPDKRIIIVAASEVEAYKASANYWYKEIIKALYPQTYIDENGEEDIYFPQVTVLGELINIETYEIEDGIPYKVFTKA